MIRSLVGLAAISLTLGLAACGGDDEERPSTGSATNPPAATETATTETATAPTQTAPATAPVTETSPEEQPGGAGDEEPARSEAMFAGRGGRITPRLVEVPPFIAIRVSLRSADGRTYALRFGRRTLRVDGTDRSASADFAGLRTGRALVGEPVGGAGNRVRVEASAEPGP